MSAPTPDFDELLSDLLDGRLDEAATHRMHQQLQDDPVLRGQYEDIVSDRRSLRALFADRQQAGGLPRDFASRVMTESRRRGLSTNSLKVRPSHIAAHDRTTTPSRVVRRRIVAGLAATAAAVLVTVSMNLSDRPDADAYRSVAQVPSQTSQSPEPASQSIPSPTAPTTRSDDVRRPTFDDIASTGTGTGTAAIDAMPDESADSSSNASPLSEPKSDMSANVAVSTDESVPLFDAAFTGAVMVYDVRLTSQGRDAGTFANVMQRSGLSDVERQPINRDVIAASKSANTFGDDDKFQILFLQASAKKVDSMFLDLLRDRGMVESVGLSLITDSPILQMASELSRVDAREVKHDRPLSLELGGDDEQLETLRRLLGEQAYLPLNAGEGLGDASGLASPASSGSDVITRVLILVR